MLSVRSEEVGGGIIPAQSMGKGGGQHEHGYKAGVTKAEIDAAMQAVVENNVFTSTGGDLVEAVEGYLRTTTTDKISA